MRKLLVLGIVLVFSILLLSLVYAQNETCTDSDGGINKYVKGIANYSGYFYEDHCAKGGESSQWSEGTADVGDVIEYACYDNSNNFLCGKSYCHYKVQKCPYGCENGACIKEEKPATEGYAYAYWECKSGDKSSISKENKVCKTERQWWNEAKEFCNGELGTFSAAQKCVINAEPISEKITCKFENSKEEQQCYLAGQSGPEDEGTKFCKADAGSSSCVIIYSGYKGEQITWKSTCGQYQYTTQDGNDEVIYFKCTSGETNIDEIEKNGFKNAYFQCYDGEESSSTGREACKSAEFWQKFAEQFCESHCKKYEREGIEKCGVNTFSIGDECYLGEGLCLERESVEGCCERWSQENNIIKPACVGEWDIEENKCSWSCKEEEEFEPALVCKNSCPLNEKCYPFGYRKAGEYCSDEGKFVEQGEENCDNNFECKSNVCVDGKCVSSSFIQKIIEWFKRLFG